MYLLDTNICIYALNGRHPRLTDQLLTIHPSNIAVSTITVGELAYGAAKSRWGITQGKRYTLFFLTFKCCPLTAAMLPYLEIFGLHLLLPERP